MRMFDAWKKFPKKYSPKWWWMMVIYHEIEPVKKVTQRNKQKISKATFEVRSAEVATK